MITIALPKGRLGEDTEKILLETGIISQGIERDSRRLIFDVGEGIRAILVRAWDVPTYVEMGTADVGICGKDDLMEHGADVFEVLDLGFGGCTMAVAASQSVSREELLGRHFLRVATKYPRVARRFFDSLSLQTEILKLYGSVELAAVTGLADCIVDIVSTGATLRENGLHVVERIFDSTARWIVNRKSFYMHYDIVSHWTAMIKNYIQGA
ncbi:ATP phosphoribosyltransferase [Thermospira aquatica]|uniref:ATP phosphoribosyltransferase n=1 Tax=Thermospira aquatica TaxID=2828656 RepID=A0AAX3BDJ9_9SPIR|nr:ATP phosphoribosyltransferase [Thermospira aquatica]URA10180.1 ATP phosphoribosyltransferase [Thermospira aquatica]